ncbi:MAG: hypothetical protein J6R35_00375 [Clostridia bacterium]|nr:hypothetical protein [Clostridia bacterium]
MIYLRKTFEYLFKLEKGKRFIVLFLLALPVGLAASFASPNYIYYQWLSNYSVGNLNFVDAMFYNGTANPISVAIGAGCALVAFMYCLSVISSVISRNLRVGLFSINRIIREFNECIFPCFYAIIFYALVAIIAKVLIALLMVLFQTFEGVVLSAILSVVSLIVVIALVCLLIAYGILFLPYMTFNGLRPLVAFTQATNRVGGRTLGKLYVAVFFPIIFNYIIGGLVGIAQSFIASVIVETILYTYSIVYLVTLSFISYYEINELPREDYPREFFYTKIKRR